MIRFHLISPKRRALLLAGALVAGGCALWAQPDGPPPDGPPPGDMQQPQRGPNADRELKHLTRLLTLTEDQQVQVKAILTNQSQQIKALFDQSKSNTQGSASSPDAANGPNPEAMASMHAQMKVIRDAANSKIAALLTDAQKTKFNEWLEQRAKREAQMSQDDMPPPPPDGGGPGGGGPPPGP